MMNNIERYSDKEWAELACLLSEEQSEKNDLLRRFMADDSHNTVQQWKELNDMINQNEIDVDRAWNKVSSRLKEGDAETTYAPVKFRFTGSSFLRVAAIAFILIGLGSALFFINNTGVFTKSIKVVTDNDKMNLQVRLPDGSNVFLNRNTKLSYKSNIGKSYRQVTLSGEAFFEITPDAAKPFIVDAGKALIQVLGTSFNVITKNNESAVEVLVKTGTVRLVDSSGSRNLVLDPGFVGTIDSKLNEKKLNNNPNYMSWNTGRLIYEGQKLDVVFHDLKRMYNIEIITSEPEILNLPIATSFNNEPHETIIRVICTTFNLSYNKDGNVYHLRKK